MDPIHILISVKILKLLQLFRRILQHWLAVKLQKCFEDYEIWSDVLSAWQWVYNDSIFILVWTHPLNCTFQLTKHEHKKRGGNEWFMCAWWMFGVMSDKITCFDLVTWIEMSPFSLQPCGNICLLWKHILADRHVVITSTWLAKQTSYRWRRCDIFGLFYPTLETISGKVLGTSEPPKH